MKKWTYLGTRMGGASAWIRSDKVRVEVMKDGKKWGVSRDLRPIISKRYKTKRSAIRFAKSYMKKIKW